MTSLLSVSTADARVLLVDDNETLALSLTETLGAHGFSVTSARGTEEATVLLRREAPDVILCDVVMDPTTGLQFLAQLKDHPEWCHIPFIFLSSLSSSEDVRSAKALGCDDYVTKPFDLIDLVTTLQGKIARARERRKVVEEQLERFRRRVINTLSHEFRTPLVAISTGTEILLDEQAPITEQHTRNLLESIQRGGLRLQRLVDDFMTLQQIDSGAAAAAAKRHRRKVPILLVAELAVENFVDHAREPLPHIELSSGLDDVEVCVLAYEAQVVNAAQRLLSNAAKFGGREQVVTVKVVASDRWCSIFIRDRGPGLAAKQTKAARELFEQIDRDRFEQQGCGLGLSIAQYFAELNGGDIYFHHPADSIGLEVELRLPRTF